MSRPSTAGSYRTSASTVGDHGQRSKFATVKSRYSQSASKQRPASAPVTRKAQVKSGTATASKILRHNGDIFAVRAPPLCCTRRALCGTLCGAPWSGTDTSQVQTVPVL
eukprot:TRINITY_DN1768_c0_g1_i2.p2 TRINITY_DN1768_c0_g1~~TRINITY_DN1768_c0_g1_i2.p2  ORF type:complete len:109 (+),score=5.95 TRINITY_DN1768_c0_g1_i2:207-533(+)